MLTICDDEGGFIYVFTETSLVVPLGSWSMEHGEQKIVFETAKNIWTKCRLNTLIFEV